MAGYHKAKIPKGILGTPSKIVEEFHEFKDALEQNNRVMALVELSDLLGAIEAYLDEDFKGAVTINDLLIMTAATQKAFEDGTR